MVVPNCVDDVAGVLRFVAERGVPLFVLGRGSNLLISDEGFRGLVLGLGSRLGGFEIDGDEVIAQTGTPLPILAKKTAEAGLAGLEFAAGIPGSLGGSVRMNAGTKDGAIDAVLREVTSIRRDGSLRVCRRDELNFSYRSSSFADNGEVVVGARIGLTRDSPRAAQERVRENLAYRTRTQPLAIPSAGSVFRNPPGDTAGRLLEQAGCKGKRVGGAEVSRLHANWIINTGGATASDIWRLIQQVSHKVEDAFGLRLALEIERVGSGFE
jgi:UDP-N-acetylmuramate dehydrogenase